MKMWIFNIWVVWTMSFSSTFTIHKPFQPHFSWNAFIFSGCFSGPRLEAPQRLRGPTQMVRTGWHWSHPQYATLSPSLWVGPTLLCANATVSFGILLKTPNSGIFLLNWWIRKQCRYTKPIKRRTFTHTVHTSNRIQKALEASEAERRSTAFLPLLIGKKIKLALPEFLRIAFYLAFHSLMWILFVDTPRQLLYWADQGTRTISRVSLEGRHRKTVVESNGYMDRPFGLAVFEVQTSM